MLSTGHLSPGESLTIAKEAQKVGFSKLIFGHPLAHSVGATLAQAKDIAKLGAYVELVALNVFANNKLSETVEFIEELGADRCILTTDTFGAWAPAGPEFLRMFLGRLLMSGVGEKELRTMVADNPATLLGIPLIEQGYNS